MLGDDERATALERDYTQADLSPRERGIVDYALKLTLEPSSMAECDVEKLRQLGLTDRAILDACQVTCYYNYVNRLANGLGVPLEDYWEADP